MPDTACTTEPSLRLWWRSDGQWLHRRFATSDPAWRETFTDLASSGNVRLEYLSRDSALRPVSSVLNA